SAVVSATASHSTGSFARRPARARNSTPTNRPTATLGEQRATRSVRGTENWPMLLTVPARSTPAPIELSREECRLYPRSSRLEWLLTNGTGGFAMGTVAGSNTRRYHGLLVASLHPPVARVVTLSRIEETALTPQGAVPLSVNQYPNTLYPDGYTRLAGFT